MGIKAIVNEFVGKQAVKYIFGKVKEDQHPNAHYENSSVVSDVYFDGQKTYLGMGDPLNFVVDYYAIRQRAWEAYLKTDFVQNAIRKYVLWVVGPGLKLQSEPDQRVLKARGLSLSDEELSTFIENAESQFRLFANTKESTYTKNDNLHDLAVTATTNSLLAGDGLIVQRLENGIPTTQFIDGGLITSPFGKFMDLAEKRGNAINYGIETNKRGEHVAFYIKKTYYEWTRIKARQFDGTLQAWLMTGLKSKENDVRGMSLLTAVLETASKMDRYKEASLTNAEQGAKTVATIVHDALSDASNPFMKNIAQTMGKVTAINESVVDGEARAPKIAEQIDGTVVNMGPGQKLVSTEHKTDGNFKEYFTINMEVIYSTLGIPPEVAKDLFTGAYSGSRAALKSWEYKINTDREIKLNRQFYGPIYDYWLNSSVLQQNIQAKGYIDAMVNGDYMILAAYRKKRLIGSTVPHIDPLKEVNAERKALGPSFDNVPLRSAEQSAENLNSGDFPEIIKKTENELEIAKNFIPNPDDNGVSE